MTYETLKVFDCQDMPDEVREDFFLSTQQGNDCLVTVYVDDESLDEAEQDDGNLVSVILWLRENGAIEDEKVIVKHWW